MQGAQQPLQVEGKDPAKDPYLTINNGMRATATELGITQSRIPKAAEVTLDARDAKSMKATP